MNHEFGCVSKWGVYYIPTKLLFDWENYTVKLGDFEVAFFCDKAHILSDKLVKIILSQLGPITFLFAQIKSANF